MSRSYEAYLLDILDRLLKITRYTSGYDYNRFSEDEKTIDAVVRNIEVIGEASKGLSDEIKRLDTEIPWKAIAGMRDKLIHDYFGIDILFVWNTVERDIPELTKRIQSLIKQVGQ